MAAAVAASSCSWPSRLPPSTATAIPSSAPDHMRAGEHGVRWGRQAVPKGGQVPKFMVISSDCHAGANGDEYRPYIDPAYRDRFDDYMKMAGQLGGGGAKGSNPELEEANS